MNELVITMMARYRMQEAETSATNGNHSRILAATATRVTRMTLLAKLPDELTELIVRKVDWINPAGP